MALTVGMRIAHHCSGTKFVTRKVEECRPKFALKIGQPLEKTTEDWLSSQWNISF